MVADGGSQGEAVAAEAGGGDEALDAGDGADHRQVVRREGLEAGPAARRGPAGEGRVDGARGLETRLHAPVQQLVAIGRVVGDARGPASADQVRAVVELLQAQPVVEGAQHRREPPRRGLGEQHLERARLDGQAHAHRGEQRAGPGARGHDGRVAVQATAVVALHRGQPPALHPERPRAHALLHARAEAPRRGREGAHGGHRVRLPVHRAVHAAPAARRDAGRETPRRGRVHQLHRHPVGPLLGHPARRRAPRGVVEREPQPAPAPVAGGRLQLAIQIGPAGEARERQRALGGVAAHHPHARRARPGGRRAHALALEHGHARARIRAAQVEGGAQPHEPAAHDHDSARHDAAV